MQVHLQTSTAELHVYCGQILYKSSAQWRGNSPLNNDSIKRLYRRPCSYDLSFILCERENNGEKSTARKLVSMCIGQFGIHCIEILTTKSFRFKYPSQHFMMEPIQALNGLELWALHEFHVGPYPILCLHWSHHVSWDCKKLCVYFFYYFFFFKPVPPSRLFHITFAVVSP